MTRILSWNILQGGGRRIDEIATYITVEKPDIVALQEFRHGRQGEILETALKKIGLGHQFCASDTGENTLFIAAREPFDAGAFMPDQDGPCHIIEAVIGDLTLLNIHFPQKKAQVPLFDVLAKDTPSLLAGHCLMLGDMNCGIPFVDSTGKTFENTKYFQELLSLGWIDAWRTRHGDAQVFSWISPRTGNGFRYDHCFASKDADARIVSVDYDQSVREKKLSDHAAILLEMRA